MKKTLFLLGLAGISLVACKKETEETTQNPSNATSLSELTVPEDFNWSNSFKGRLDLTLQADDNFNTESKLIQIVDELGNVLESKKVASNKVTFYLNLPQTEGTYYAYFPSTGDKMELKGTGSAAFKVHTNLETQIEEMIKNAVPANRRKASYKKSAATNLLVNGDFSQNDFKGFYNGYNVGAWYKWNDNYTWDTENGSKAWRAKNKKYSYISQLINISSGDSVIVNTDCYASAYGNAYVGIYFYNTQGQSLGGNFHALQSGLNNSTVAEAVRSGAVQAEVILYGYNKTWFDNVTTETVSAILDADNDGVEDSQDEFPNDPSKAYTASYPTAGTQKVAFEDMWPYQGDFDFNDMVIDTRIDYTLNANSELVDAQFSITLQACGAGLNNGLAINFVDASKNPMQSSIISSVNGATIDPDNTNGIIVFNDAFAAQSSYYTNTGTGADATPEEFTFSVTFASGVSQAIIPDWYIFRTNNRGQEVHLSGFSGSAAADTQLYGTADDVNGTYKTAAGLPWAIEVTSYDSFQHPMEKVDILIAYPNFQQWATSGGLLNLDWFETPDITKIF